MACIELYASGNNSLSHRKARIWLPVAFKINSRHTHQNLLKPSPVSERSAYPLQNYVCFSLLTSGLESFGHKSTHSHRPWIGAYCPKFYKNGWGLECWKVNFLEYLGQGTLGCHSFSSLLFACFSSPTNIHTHSSKLFTLHYIQ